MAVLAPENDVPHSGGFQPAVSIVQQLVAGLGKRVEVLELFDHLVPEEQDDRGQDRDQHHEENYELLQFVLRFKVFSQLPNDSI
ncbi:MAG TPA: hypothetical protein DEB09_00070 [Candidatus Magasanikbacteria bacterium]|nr:hypothetical protein [Candidatus Magasanikbacteria bacterium]